MALAALFGRRKTPEEMLRQNQRALNKVIRELDRERTQLERQEKKLVVDIKKMAKSGQMDAVKIMAKDLVRTRQFIKKFILMKANIQGIALKIQTLKSQAAMATAMKGVTKALKRMNTKMNLPQLQKIMMEFERESEIMDLKEETISDTTDDVLGEGDEEEETEVIVNQVLDELGISLDHELSDITPGLDKPHVMSSGGPIMEEGEEAVGDDGIIVGGAMNEDEYNQDDFHHDSFGGPPRPVEPNKWDEEEDCKVQQREEYKGEMNTTSSGGGGGATGNRTDMNSPSGRSNSQIARAGTVRKSINRSSSFVKTGSENFILAQFPAKIAIQPGSKIKIVASPDNNTSPMWEPNPEPYTIEVRDPEKKKTFKGIKSFLAYSVIPTSTGRAVSRGYKHYAWLHDRLEEKFSIHCVPPLPDKQYYVRYGEDFVEKRREKLQRWSNRIARHPVISRSDVFIHFIHCDDEGSQWKTGKRRAEKDEVMGPVYLQTFHHPDVSIDMTTAHPGVLPTFGRVFSWSHLCTLYRKCMEHSKQLRMFCQFPIDLSFWKDVPLCLSRSECSFDVEVSADRPYPFTDSRNIR